MKLKKKIAAGLISVMSWLDLNPIKLVWENLAEEFGNTNHPAQQTFRKRYRAACRTTKKN